MIGLTGTYINGKKTRRAITDCNEYTPYLLMARKPGELSLIVMSISPIY